jgi:O-antigen ligase
LAISIPITRPPLVALGLLSFVVFVLSGLEEPAIALGAFLLLGALILVADRKALRDVGRHPLLPISVVFTAYVVVSGLVALTSAPDRWPDILRWVAIYTTVTGLPAFLVAAWFAREPRLIFLACNLFLLALLVAIVDNVEPDQLQNFWEGERALFRIGNAAGLFILSSMLGIVLLFFLERPALAPAFARWRRWVAWGYGIALVILIVAFLIHQNRSAWVGLLVTVPILVALSYRRLLDRSSGKRHKTRSTAAILALATFLGLGIVGSQHRFQEGFAALGQAIEGGIDQLEAGSSMGDRLRIWRAGSASVTANPVFGQGPGTARAVLQNHEDIAHYPHFHSVFLQITAELGVAGLLLFCLVLVTLLGRVHKTYRRDGLAPTLYLFLLGTLILFLVMNLAQVRIHHSHDMFFVTLLFALLIATGTSNTGRPSSSAAD